MFGFNFAPRSWAYCDGGLLPIAQNTALFSILGTTFGGDGQTTFRLPNMQGRAPMHAGRGPGLPTYFLGELTGSETVTLNTSHLPSHSHTMRAVNAPGKVKDPTNAMLGGRASGGTLYTDSNTNPVNMASTAVANSGGSKAHGNMQPYQVASFCIALDGLYPSRS